MNKEKYLQCTNGDQTVLNAIMTPFETSQNT